MSFVSRKSSYSAQSGLSEFGNGHPRKGTSALGMQQEIAYNMQGMSAVTVKFKTLYANGTTGSRKCPLPNHMEPRAVDMNVQKWYPSKTKYSHYLPTPLALNLPTEMYMDMLQYVQHRLSDLFYIICQF